jgi:predicted membrane GTPase involved in stress response
MLTIHSEYLQKSLNYQEYKSLTNNLVEEKATTGDNQSEFMVAYTALNWRRMQRIEKTTKILPDIQNAFEENQVKMTWLVLTEPWCGDAAHIVPIMSLLSQLSNRISFQLLLRDENLDLMDQFLTNGGRAIPKLLVLNEKNEVINTWGPRPQVIQNIVMELKAKGVEKNDMLEQIQLAYHHDKYVSVQKELSLLLHTK